MGRNPDGVNRKGQALSPKAEEFCRMFVNAIDTGITEREILRMAGYEYTGTERVIHQNELHKLAELKKDKRVQARISQLMKERDNAMVFDRYYVLKGYKDLLKEADRVSQKKQILDSMAKCLGMFTDVQVSVDKSTDPAEIARRGLERAKQKDKEEQAKKDGFKVIDGKKAVNED